MEELVIARGGGTTVRLTVELPEFPVASVAVTVKLYEVELAFLVFAAPADKRLAPAGGVPCKVPSVDSVSHEGSPEPVHVMGGTPPDVSIMLKCTPTDTLGICETLTVKGGLLMVIVIPAEAVAPLASLTDTPKL